MCGLTGFISFKKEANREILDRMAQTLLHRGPNDSGSYFNEAYDYQIGMAFRRLSIIDLSAAGHQPMIDVESGRVLIFNGEIYNYREIKVELEKDGFTFKSNSDTEVILKAFTKWGKNCVERFIGMFAIIVYDPNNHKVYFFRDRFGVKPLYLYEKNGLMMFASELKAFHMMPSFDKTLSNEAISSLLKYDYITGKNSIFKYCVKVQPGYCYEYDINSSKTIEHCYWDSDKYYTNNHYHFDFKTAIDELEKILISAFNYRMVSDVPVGIFLSGGYDSSCVAALLQKNNTAKLKTFTIGFDEEGYNEAPFAKRVAEYLGTDHLEFFCSFKDAIDIVPNLADIYDEPFGDQSAIPTTLVSAIAKKYVTVALSADGGDELFAGYPRHRKSLQSISRMTQYKSLLGFVNQFTKRSGIRGLSKSNKFDKLNQVVNSEFVPSTIFSIINQTLSDAECTALFPNFTVESKSGFSRKLKDELKNDALKSILSTEVKTYLVDDILAKVDRATMSVSLEGREPFLDHRILELVASFPKQFLIDANGQKKILKEIVHKYIPSEMMERPKMGFGIPLEKWCRSELKEIFDDQLSIRKIKRSGCFNSEIVTSSLNAYHRGEPINFQKLWNIFTFQMWYERWM
ncbi:asparagine synthase (glutamine-hydrolyzing) [soil metagenome]